MDGIVIRKAVVHVKIPIVCSSCGQKSFSQTMQIEITDTDPAGLLVGLDQISLGTNFPVGWAKYHGVPHDRLVCPDCPKK